MQEASGGSDPQGERLASLNEGVQSIRQALAEEAVKRDERIRLANAAIADAQGAATKAIRAAIGAGLVAVLAVIVGIVAIGSAHTANEASNTATAAAQSAKDAARTANRAITAMTAVQAQACTDRKHQWTALHDSIIEQNRVRAVSPVVLALLPAEFRAFVTPGTPEYLAAVAAANEKRDRALGRLGVKPVC